MKPRHKRLAVIVSGVIGLTAASLFVLNAFQSNLVFFFSPTEALAGKAPVDKVFRLGGMVENGSVKKSPDGLKTDFVITDMNQRIEVHYEGLLPDLFREGQGVVTQGPATSLSRALPRSDGKRASSRVKCSPSTTKTTCHPRPPRRCRAARSFRARTNAREAVCHPGCAVRRPRAAA